ncbi:hypothetical protein GBA52_024638 [Prunus armeniaca]|nr:hypothetical protein GBA52_024638 [Prunus armeniaca]
MLCVLLCLKPVSKHLTNITTSALFSTKPTTTSILLRQCKSLLQAKLIHQHILVQGLTHTVTDLIAAYVACNAPSQALALLQRLVPCPSIVFWWNVLIRSAVRSGLLYDVLCLHGRMQMLGWRPDHYTYPFVLKACGELHMFSRGSSVHAALYANGFDSNVFVCNAVVAMYGRCGALNDARKMFDELLERGIGDVVSWNSIVSAYVQSGDSKNALSMFDRMMGDFSVRPDAFSLVNVLPACASAGAPMWGKQIHSYAIRRGLFEDMREEEIELNVVTWSAVIAGYAQRGHGYGALDVFRQMQACGSEPNAVTLVSLLSGCASAGALIHGKETHCYAIKWILNLDRNDPGNDMMVINGLIDMYTKCKSPKVARMMFDSVAPKKRNVVTWTVMIGGYAQHGEANEALELFYQMLRQDFPLKPNAFTISCALMACARLGALRCVTGRFGILIGVLHARKNTLPSLGVGRLKLCGDDHCVYGTDKDHPLRPPEDPFYKQMAAEFTKFQIRLYTGGQVYYYPNFQSTIHGEKLRHELARDLTRETAWEAVIYTASCGERRIRVHTAAAPEVTDLGEMYPQAATGAIVTLLSRLF